VESLLKMCHNNQARIKGLVGPRHFVTFAEQKFFFRLYSKLFTYMLHFVGPFFLSLTFVGPIFSRRPKAFCLVCLMVNPAVFAYRARQSNIFYLSI